MSQFFKIVVSSARDGNLVSEKFWDAIQIILASFFIGLCAQIEIPLYFSPISFTAQTFAIMLVAAVLGKEKGLLAAFAYLVQGSFGYPVFAGGSFGFHHLIGPSGGYLLCYPLQAYLFGWSIRSLSYQLFKVSIVCVLQLGVGSLWLCQFVKAEYAFMMGFYPFIFLEIAKAFSVYYLYFKKWR